MAARHAAWVCAFACALHLGYSALTMAWPYLSLLATRASESIRKTLERELIFSGLLVAVSGAIATGSAMLGRALRRRLKQALFTSFTFPSESAEYKRYLLAWLEDKARDYHSLIVRPMTTGAPG